uniref:Prominin-1-A n=1 Tax=Magallana gigas TaxID=29159 RepID=K1RD67_MAGGI
MEGMKLRVWLYLSVWGALCVWMVVGANGGFTLPPGPPSPDYKADDVKYEDGGMGPLYNFARKFINMCLSDIKDVIEVIKDAIKGKIGSNVQDILQMVRSNFLGFSISVVVGLLFIVIFPIVGCCFCCCRVACKACCAQPDEEDPSVSCKKAIYGTILFVIVAFTAAGNICVYVSNDRISLALTEIVDNVDKNLDDIKLFMEHSSKQVDSIKTNFQTAKTELDNHLDATKLSEALQKKAISLLTGGAVDHLQTDIDDVISTVTNVNTAMNDFQAACPPAVCSSPISPPNLQTLPSIDISNQVAISAAKTQLNSADTKIGNLVDNTKDAIQKVAGDVVNIKDTKTMVKNQKDFITPYDKYRWYAGIGCGGIVSLILALYCCGICCGCCGGRSVNDPLEKGCVSNCAGRLMIGSLVFIFVFCPLLMLITTLMYIPGAIIERYVCQPFTDPNLEFLDELMDSFEMNFDNIVKHEPGHEMSLKSFLGNCKNNMAIYKALDLEHLTLFSFKFSDLENEVQNIMNHMNTGMGTMLNDKTAFGSANLLPAGLVTNLDGIKNTMSSLDLTSLNNATAVDDVKHQLNAATTNMQSNGMTNIAQSFVNDTVNIIDVYFKDVKGKLHNEIGQCQPLWNLYNSIIKISLCQYIVDAFNGFWFSIGWCIFFLLPGAVVGTKLSNFLRDVKYVYDNNHDAESGKSKRTKNLPTANICIGDHSVISEGVLEPHYSSNKLRRPLTTARGHTRVNCLMRK